MFDNNNLFKQLKLPTNMSMEIISGLPIRAGDLVMIHLETSRYVGYCWGRPSSQTSSRKGGRSDLVFSGVDPEGATSEQLGPKLGYVGLDLKNKTLEGEPVRGYEIIRPAAMNRFPVLAEERSE